MNIHEIIHAWESCMLSEDSVALAELEKTVAAEIEIAKKDYKAATEAGLNKEFYLTQIGLYTLVADALKERLATVPAYNEEKPVFVYIIEEKGAVCQEVGSEPTRYVRISCSQVVHFSSDVMLTEQDFDLIKDVREVHEFDNQDEFFLLDCIMGTHKIINADDKYTDIHCELIGETEPQP
jgi:hypothetical protein